MVKYPHHLSPDSKVRSYGMQPKSLESKSMVLFSTYGRRQYHHWCKRENERRREKDREWERERETGKGKEEGGRDRNERVRNKERSFAQETLHYSD